MNHIFWLLCSLVISFIFKALWYHSPGLSLCVIFWLFTFIWMMAIGSRAMWLIPGFFCNALVTIGNGGHMPTLLPPYDGFYVPYGPDTFMPGLSDWLPGESSPGDWMLAAGLLLAVFFPRTNAAIGRLLTDIGRLGLLVVYWMSK